MIKRQLKNRIIKALQNVPIVAILGPRQVGKTTLAFEISSDLQEQETSYLDLELDSDMNKLQDSESYLKRFKNVLLIIDEVQRKPDLFPNLRGLVDLRRKAGEKAGQFLLLGSASRDRLQLSSETLAGRIRYIELTPLNVIELFNADKLGFNVEKLWFRGGFPGSFLATDEEESWEWLNDFISTYVERDIPMMGPQIPANRLKKFWQMVSHFHGQQIVYSDIAKSLEVSHTTVKSYLDILTDFYMIRQLQPWAGNTKKRLVKSPKIYLRDSGILHKLLNISSIDTLFGHPMLGASWEGFVVENIIGQLSNKWQYSYYRSASQTEIDLVLEGPNEMVWAVEIKRSASPKISRGFHLACQDIKATAKFIVYSGREAYPLGEDTEVIGLIAFLELLSEIDYSKANK
ncbi:MAG: ATP-binding protein [Pedobacter sp.]|nr:MAG: ATP-binding protein [Pedobacter sp.]